MKHSWLGLTFGALFFWSCTSNKGQDFIIYYGQPQEIIKKNWEVDPIVVEPDHSGWNSTWLKNNKIYAYVSLGEINKNREYYSRFANKNWLVEINPNWPESYRIDFRSNEWQEFLLKEYIPSLISQGYSGLFFDTIDTPTYLEDLDPQRFLGGEKALANFVVRLKKMYPQLKIILNNSIEIAMECGESADYLLVESLHATYDFDKKTYIPQDSDHTQIKTEKLQKLQRQFPHLQILSLEYVNLEATNKEQKTIINQNQKLGFKTLLSQIELNQVPKFE